MAGLISVVNLAYLW